MELEHIQTSAQVDGLFLVKVLTEVAPRSQQFSLNFDLRL